MSGVTSAEASALHAVLAADPAEAERILRGFLPGELRELERACGELGALCANVRRDPIYEAPDWSAAPPGAVVDVADDLDDECADCGSGIRRGGDYPSDTAGRVFCCYGCADMFGAELTPEWVARRMTEDPPSR